MINFSLGYINKKAYKLILLIVIILSVMLLFACSKSQKEPMRAMDLSDESIIFVDIPSGASTKCIAKILYENDLIRSEKEFVKYAKVTEIASKMKAGNYAFSRSMDATKIAQMIANGEIYIETFTFTIPEGYEYRQMLEIWQNLGLDVNSFNTAIDDILIHHKDKSNQGNTYDFLGEIVLGTHAEGYLFPDTYEFKKGASEKQIIERMLSRFDEIFKPEYYERANELGMSVNEVITLASIIEREAQRDDERTLISGVFHNRLNKKWKLQSCATVQYVLEDRKAILTFDDIAIDSPYNTYQNIGLPPAPISSVGEKSIIAALYPEKTEYMFFVAKEDGTGGHIFSKTLKEHNKAIKSVKN